MTEMAWVDEQTDNKEWNWMWEQLRQSGEDIEAVNLGECWQYMGSHREGYKCWIHDFRHRCHPKTQDRHYKQVPASQTWQPKGDIAHVSSD